MKKQTSFLSVLITAYFMFADGPIHQTFGDQNLVHEKPAFVKEPATKIPGFHFFNKNLENCRHIYGLIKSSSYRTEIGNINAPDAPLLVGPLDQVIGLISRPMLKWQALPNVNAYHLQVSLNSGFTTTVFDDTTIVENYRQVGTLQNGKTFYWRVRAKDANGWGNFSDTWRFTTKRAPSVSTTSIRSSFVSPGSRPNGLVWDGQNLWMIDNLKTLYKLDTSGNVLFSKNFPELSSDLSDLTWDGTGIWIGECIYVNSELSHLKVDTLGNKLDTFSLSYWWHDGIEWDGKYFWLGDYNSSVIYKHKADGTGLLNFNTNGLFGHPTGISYDGVNLWVAGSGEGFDNMGEIFKYTTTGTLLAEINLSPLDIPRNYGFHSVAWDGESLWYASAEQFTIYRLNVPYFHQVPSKPVLQAPSNNSVNVPLDPTLSWSEANYADHYQVQVSTNSSFTNLVYNNTDVASNSVAIGPLNSTTTYYWRVRAINSVGAGEYSTYFTFTTTFGKPTIQSSNITFNEPGSSHFTVNWTRGNGSKCLAFINKILDENLILEDNVVYEPNPTFGHGSRIPETSWYCIYNGTGNFVEVTGLEPITTYKVMVCEYNGEGGTVLYLTEAASNNPFYGATSKLDQTITFDALQAKTLCDGEFTLEATASSGLPVSYISSNADVATISGNTLTILKSGTTTITARQLGNTIFAPAIDVEQLLTILPLPTAIFSGPDGVCRGQAVSLDVVFTGSPPWSFTYSDGTNQTELANILNTPYTLTYSPATTTTLTIIKVSDTHLCVNNQGGAKTVRVEDPPANAGNISGPPSPCQGAKGVVFSIPEIQGATSYIWEYSGTGASINGTSKQISIDFANTASTGKLTVKGANSCGNGTISSDFNIALQLLPQMAGNITGPVEVCSGSSNQVYTVGSINGATSYIWTLPYGATGSSTSNSISVNYGTGALLGKIKVKGNNSCGSGGETELGITVSEPAGDAGSIGGLSEVCQGQENINFVVPAIEHAGSYTWNYSGAGANIVTLGNTATISFSGQATSGNLTVHGSNICGNGLSSPPFALLVKKLPSSLGIINGKASLCQGEQSVVYTVEGQSGASAYMWTLPQGAAGSSTGTSISVNFGQNAISGALKVKALNQCGFGPESSLSLTLIDAAFPKIKSKWDDILLCYNLGDSLQQYQWYKNGAAISGATGQYYRTFKAAGQYHVVASDAFGCKNPSNQIEIKGQTASNVYPNPARNQIEIKLQDAQTGKLSISIINALGKTIKMYWATKDSDVFACRIPLNGLPPGVYTLEIRISGSVHNISKLVITD
jgi:hypothetical protein